MIACKNCTRRRTGCHDTCPVHHAELAEYHARKKYVSRAKKIYRSVDEAHYNSVIVLTEWKWKDGECVPVCVKAEIVDGKRIKADTWYELKDGEFRESEEG